MVSKFGFFLGGLDEISKALSPRPEGSKDKRRLISILNMITDAFSRCKRRYGLASGMNIHLFPAFHHPTHPCPHKPTNRPHRTPSKKINRYNGSLGSRYIPQIHTFSGELIGRRTWLECMCLTMI